MSHRGKFNHTESNKLFVKLHDNLSNKYKDGVIAKKLSIPTSSFSKIKLGYYYADSDILASMRKLVQIETRPSILDINTKNKKQVTVDAKNMQNITPKVQVPTAKNVKKKTDLDKMKSVCINIPSNFVGDITINVQ